MKTKTVLERLSFTIAVIVTALAFCVTSAKAAGAGPVTMTVTAVAKHEASVPAIKKDDVQLYLNKERTQIAGWKPGEKLFLAVLIDDSLESQIASQWSDLKEFFNSQPATTYISVAYARNGTAVLAQDFTNDHELAAKALRIPLGNGGAFSSPYLAVLDLMKRLPAAGERRSILMFSSGIDYLRGNFPTSPDLETAVERGEKENINVWTIYAPDAGHRARGFFRTSKAQSDLSQLSEETGAESFFLGTGLPVTLKPYFDEISAHLNNQYLLTFLGSGGKKGRFERVRVTTELPNVELMTPSNVFLPASQ
jgi:hypothetical protein